MKTETIKISRIEANKGQIEGLPKNPRLIRDNRFELLKKSIEDLPQMLEMRELIVFPLKDKFVTIGGNMRLVASKALGFKEMPCKVLDADTKPEVLAEISIKDNASFGDNDFDILANEWTDFPISDWGLDIPDFEAVESEPIEEDEAAVGEMIDKAAELNKKWQVVCGDKFSIGRHFLVCGDSTKAEDVAKLLDGAKPNLMVTDPPYGVDYDANWRNEAFKNGDRAVGKVTNDHEDDWTGVWELFKGNIAYIWHAGLRASVVQASLEIAGFDVRCQIVWSKNHFVIGRGHYSTRHEPCWYAVRKGQNANWIGATNEQTIWEYGKDEKAEGGHSTQKPVECMARPIRNHEGDVYEPFAGSGTTIVAAEQLGRICYSMELSPAYCAVICERLTTLGLEAKRIT